MTTDYDLLLASESPDAAIVLSAGGTILHWSRGAEEIFGYSPDESIGRLIFDLIVPADRLDEERLIIRNAITFGSSTAESLCRRKDGSLVHVDISSKAVFAAGSAEPMVLSATKDVTQLKVQRDCRLKALQDENLDLVNANRAKDRFLANMSHELRTPLNSIIGFTGTLLMKLPGPLTADQQMQLGIIKASAGHLLALINDLLDLAKIEAGKMELPLTPIDFAGVIREVAAALKPQAQAKGLELTVAVPARCAPIRSNPRALSQIVINLVNNAIKFTDSGGIRLEMALRNSPPPRTVEISVADTGVGIPLDAQPQLFSAFNRVHVPGHSDMEGTGLGLHLSQKLAEALGGHIEFTSEHHKGSTFTLLLPEQ